MADQRKVRIVGDGVAWEGPCLLLLIIFWPHTGSQSVDVYDGRDAVSGKKFVTVEAKDFQTLPIPLGVGVIFDQGIYLDAVHAEDETTVVFVPLDE